MTQFGDLKVNSLVSVPRNGKNESPELIESLGVTYLVVAVP